MLQCVAAATEHHCVCCAPSPAAAPASHTHCCCCCCCCVRCRHHPQHLPGGRWRRLLHRRRQHAHVDRLQHSHAQEQQDSAPVSCARAVKAHAEHAAACRRGGVAAVAAAVAAAWQPAQQWRAQPQDAVAGRQAAAPLPRMHACPAALPHSSLIPPCRAALLPALAPAAPTRSSSRRLAARWTWRRCRSCCARAT